MSSNLDARLRALERRDSCPEFVNLKPPIPLAGMSKTWQDQYHKDPEVISKVWYTTIADYHERHIEEWQQENGTRAMPPWYRLLSDDNAEWYKDCKGQAEAKLVIWQALGNKTNNDNEVENGN